MLSHTHFRFPTVLCNEESSFFTSSEVAVYYETQFTTISNKNAQIQKIMLTPLRYTPSDTKIIKNKVLPQKMWICGKIYFERFFNYFPFYSMCSRKTCCFFLWKKVLKFLMKMCAEKIQNVMPSP